ncbi:MAG: DUF2530 domain-containing protein [Ornithinimicrobium sp.]
MGGSEPWSSSRERPEERPGLAPKEVRIPTLLIVRVAMGIWLVALAVLWAVPALSAGDRSWWPWVPVAGLAVGIFGHVYVTRGRGHASGS